jgi:hypothetical protein
LADGSSWAEFDEPRRDVEDRCSVEGVEVFNVEIEAVNLQQEAVAAG